MAKEIIVNVDVNTKDAVKGVDSLDKSVGKLDKSSDKLGKTNEKTSTGMEGMGGAAGGVVNGLKAMSKAALAFIATPLGIVIGAIAVAVLAVKSAFTSSEAGQNKYNKIMGILGSILGNLNDKLSDFGELLIDTFSNPMAALENFGESLKTNIINRFDGLLEFIPKMGTAIKQLFEGDFAAASETAFNALGKVTTGVDNLTQSIKETTEATASFIAELEREAEIAGNIADKRAKADKIERGLIVERAKADRKIVELRSKAARQDLFTLQERKDALIEASEINEEITNKEIVAAQLRASAITAENALSKSTKEDLKAEEEAKARVIILETKKINLQKRLGTELSTINLQQEAQIAKEEEQAKKKEEADAVIAAKKEELLRSSGERAIAIALELKQMRADAGLSDPDATADQILEAYEIKKEVEDAIFEQELASNQERFDAKLITEQERKAQQELLEFNHTQKIEKITTDSIDNISKKQKSAADFKAKNEKLAAQGTVAVTQDVLGAVSAILDEGSAEAKAIALAQATISGIQGVQAAYTSASAVPIVGFALGPIAAIAAGVVAAKNISKISSSKTGGKSGSSGGGATPSFAPPSAPASVGSLTNETLFSTQDLEGANPDEVGSGAGINQQPIKAIVVESDITNSQNKIKDIEQGAEIG